MLVKEPVKISEEEYSKGTFDLVDQKDQQEINEEINQLYKRSVAC